MTADTPSLRAATRIGRYVVVERLGAGAMGVVYAAHDPELDRRVAVKLLHPHVAESASATRRLVREARALAQLRHENVVAVYDVGEHDGAVFVAMELVVGRSLRAWLDDNGGRRPWREVVAAFAQAARGLAAAHEVGLVHRDFKPDNAMIDGHGRVCVMDFGLVRAVTDGAIASRDPDVAREPDAPDPADDVLARVRARLVAAGHIEAAPTAAALHDAPTLAREDDVASPRIVTDDNEASVLTRRGVVLGTPAYMAPEQVRGDEVDARSDQFAFCIALFEALHGRRPFTAGHVLVLLDCIAHDRKDMTPTAAVPRWLTRLVMQGLAPSPSLRHRDMTTIARTLERGRARVRRVVVTAGVGALVGAAIVVGLTPLQSPCSDAPERLGGAWDGARRQQVVAQLESLGTPWAAATATRVSDTLDTYAMEWLQMHEDSCRATYVRGEQSDELLDRRTSCLATRREALDALARLLGEADADLGEHAVSAAAALPAIEACGELQALLDGPALPSDPAARASHDEALAEIARAQAEVTAARWNDAIGGCDRALALATTIDDDAVRGRSELVRARALDGLGRRDEAIVAFAEAAYRARVGRDDRVAAEAEVESVFEIGWRGSQIERARWQAQHAAAAVERVGDPMLEARLENNIGVVAMAAGEGDLALAHLERALELREQTLGADHLEVAESLHNLGNVERSRRNPERARVHHERELAILVAALGPLHPRVAEARAALGGIAMAEGDVAGALAIWREVEALQRDAYGRPHPALAATLSLIGNAESLAGDGEAAVRDLSAALTMLEETVGTETSDADRVRHNLGNALANRGEFIRARAVLELAAAGRERRLGPDHPDLARTLTQLAIAMLDGGDPQAARPVLVRAVAILDASKDGLAEARARFALARVLASDPRAAADAREELVGARALFVEAGPAGRKGAAELEAFAAEHPGLAH